MNPTTIISILNLISGLIPIGAQLATEVKATASETDQASIDAALANMMTQANAALTQTIQDAENAAKG
jgi:hypothetical protein